MVNTNNKFLRNLRDISLIDDSDVLINKGKIKIDGNILFNFSSNDYLGLSKDDSLIRNAQIWTKKFGTSLSSSRLISGNLDLIGEIEKKISILINKEQTIIMGSGFQCNSTLIPTVIDNSLGRRKKATIFSDKYNHSSIYHGCILSKQKLIRYNHMDLNHLETLLKKNSGSLNIIISETIFSMDGDIIDLISLRYLSKKYGCLLYLDEAHATGVFGKNGFGLTDENNPEFLDNEIVVGTFSKAFGSYGSFVSCSKDIKKKIVNNCSGFIYSTVLPPSILGTIEKAVEKVPKLKEKRRKLIKNSSFLRDQLKKNNFDLTDTESQIIPILFKKESECVFISRLLEKEGFFVHPVRSPTVPLGQSRLRISLTTLIKKTLIQKFIKKLKYIYERYKEN